MPDATITSTASTFGTISGVFSADQSTISGTISGIVPGTLTGSVGVPGPAGAAGQGVPAGGTAGQYLQKIDGTNYNTDWVTLNLSAYLTTSAAASTYYPLTNPSGYITSSSLSPYLTSATAASTYQTLAGMSSYLTTSAAAAGYYPLSGNPSGFLTSASLSGYATESWVTGQGYITSAALTPYLTSATAASTYQTLSGMSDYLAKAGNLAGLANTGTARTNLGLGSLAVVNDAPSDGSQYARKNAAWDVVIPGDRYLTSSTTSNTVSNGNKTFTIGTGLSYTPTQNITISYNAANHMHGEVLTYNSGTGVLTVDINHHTGSGTYSAWVVNVGGVTPATSVAWGAITGTLSSQTDLQNALNLKLAATTAASTYQTLAGMSSYLTSSTAATTYATILEPSVDGILTVEPSGINTATVNVNQDANNYIHLRAGAGQISMVVGGSTRWFFNDTYLQFPGGTQQTVAYPGSSGFLLKADNLSGLANTGTARTNLGLGTMAVETASNYLTTATASSTYFTIANAANKADLASPTFTGTPTLPTGTIGVTQTAGNNTTALATTAFVQQEVPSASTTAAGKVELATFDEAILGSSTTLAPTAFSAKAAIMSAEWMPVPRAGFTATTSGTGAACTLGFTNTMYQMPSSGSSGHSYARTFGFSQIDQLTNLWGDDGNIYVNFAKRIWISGRSLINLPTQANYLCRVSFGKAEASGVGDLSARGLGWKYTCGTSQVVQLMVHNGTTLTTVNSSFTPSGTAFSWDIVSDGNGTVTLYINGSSVATTTAGPSTRATSTQCLYQEEAVLTATSTNSYTRFYCARGAIYVQR